MAPRHGLHTVSTVATAALLFAATVTGAGANTAQHPPGEKVSGQPAATAVEETDQLSFQPGSVDVARGRVVEWTNNGVVAHNVTFDEHPALTSGTMHHGDRYEIRFTAPGTYPYRCTFHPGMNGTVHVSP